MQSDKPPLLGPCDLCWCFYSVKSVPLVEFFSVFTYTRGVTDGAVTLGPVCGGSMERVGPQAICSM